ncbi:hypothetical protein AB0392_48795 [Nonomuraea angiospora]|uniref:hypothetical protein n=1 Tax=Nonomuraea angiospora TaxID=46172 RepID=UPI0034502905
MFTLGVFDQLKTPALPMPAQAAASVEEIADRLRALLDDDVASAPYVTLPGTPLLSRCWPESMETRMPPEGVPAYSGELLPAGMDEPLEVRFWITSPEAAVRAVAAARRGTEECGRSDGDVLKDVAGFNQWGWRGVQALVTMDGWTEFGDPGAGATIVAARGGLLAEVTWAWPYEVDGEPDPLVLRQGTASATAVLAAVGGDPAGSAPVTASTRSAAAAVAAALPPPSAYGKDLVSWPRPGDGPLSHELVCQDRFFKQNAYAGAPAVTRRLIGEVSVREDVLFLPDEPSAEEARVRPLTTGSEIPIENGPLPCGSEDARSYSIAPRRAPFTRGPWTGEIETFAVGRPDLRRRPFDHDSVAHVVVAVRHGSTMVYLRWQASDRPDPAAALRAGRAALTRTLDRLPTSG